MVHEAPGGPSERDCSNLGGLQIGIVVRDLEATTPFYRDGLGLERLGDLETEYGLLRFFGYGIDGSLKLIQLNEPPSQANPPGGIAGDSTGPRWFTVHMSGLEDIVERCEAAGGRAVHPIQQARPGSRYVMVEDPEGSCWVEVVDSDVLR